MYSASSRPAPTSRTCYPYDDWGDRLSPDPGGPAICAAEGCEAGAQLNFIYFLYQRRATFPGTASLVFDPSQTGSLLYSQYSSYDRRDGSEPYRVEQFFYVTPVPLPPAIGLLLSGLGAMSWLARRRHVRARKGV